LSIKDQKECESCLLGKWCAINSAPRQEAKGKNNMARVLNRADVIEHLKAGGEVTGTPIQGYSIKGGQYDGWTVRSDTLVSLLQAGLIEEEPDKISYYNHYRWKRSEAGG
jgi:hypothetical protein